MLCQVSSLKVFSVSLVTVNPLEFNSLPNSSSAAIPSISDVDVSGSCFLNKIDLEEQDTQQRKNIKSNWNENEVLQLKFNVSLHNHSLTLRVVLFLWDLSLKETVKLKI